MPQFERVTIVGVGLIGSSIGLALRARGLAGQVVGVGRRQATLRKARQTGAITSGTLDLERGVAGSELVLVATPVDDIARHVLAAARGCSAGALITDAGSTKAKIVSAIDGHLPDGVAFVGSHPLAGGEQSGPEHGRADLFQNKLVVMTPTRRTRPKDLARTRRFWTALGARTVEMSPAEHDRAVAATSHLPHLAAVGLAAATDEEYLPLAATGWLDTTRIASGGVELWTQILLDNRDNALKSLAAFEKVMAAISAALKRGDRRRLTEVLGEAKRKRDAVGS